MFLLMHAPFSAVSFSVAHFVAQWCQRRRKRSGPRGSPGQILFSICCFERHETILPIFFEVSHDTVCAKIADLAGESEDIPGVVVDWKPQVAAWPRATRGYEADIGLSHIPGIRDIYLDGVLSLANPRTYEGCESKAGKVAELWARRKNREHPVFDRNTGRRLHPFDFRALAFERHGFIAKETVALIRKLASIKAAHFELSPSEEIRRWYVAVSCCVQRANARILRGEAVPGRGSSVPSRLLAGRYDLPLGGS